jgi:dienelactone hydrolase
MPIRISAVMSSLVVGALLFQPWLSGCGQAAQVDSSSGPFNYDSSQPLHVHQVRRQQTDRYTITDLTYLSPPHLTIRAYLVEPPGDRPFPAVLFQHWYAPAQGGDRTEFLDEAKQLAAWGMASLLVQGVVPWSTTFTGLKADKKHIRQQVVALRRAVDLLRDRREVNAERLGFVGHDYGAMYGAFMAGVDHRVDAYVLMAGAPSFADWAGYFSIPPQQLSAYAKGIRPVDPTHFVSYAHPSSLLFQFGRTDRFISTRSAQQFYRAASKPKTVRWYDADHALNSAAQRDRDAWLVTHVRA